MSSKRELIGAGARVCRMATRAQFHSARWSRHTSCAAVGCC